MILPWSAGPKRGQGGSIDVPTNIVLTSTTGRLLPGCMCSLHARKVWIAGSGPASADVRLAISLVLDTCETRSKGSTSNIVGSNLPANHLRSRVKPGKSSQKAAALTQVLTCGSHDIGSCPTPANELMLCFGVQVFTCGLVFVEPLRIVVA